MASPTTTRTSFGQGAQRLVKLQLTKSAAETEENELTPDDYDIRDLSPAKKERALVNLVLRDFKRDAIARRTHESEWLMCIAMEAGNQWVEWRSVTNRLESIKDPADPYRSYHTSPYIRPLVERQCSRATGSKPDVSFAPYTTAPIHVSASKECEDIEEFYNQKFNMQAEWLNWVSGSLIASTTFRKIRWNPKDKALLWSMGAQGIEVKESADAGDIDECLVPSWEMFPAAQSRGHWHEAPHITHCKLMPLNWFVENFGERGKQVKSDVAGNVNTWFDAVLDAISGDMYRGDPMLSGYAYYYERWEKPSPRFSEGRMIPVGGTTLLVEPDDVDWPYDKKDEYPFVALDYGTKHESVWSSNMVYPLIQTQRAINQIWSRFLDRLNTLKPTIVVSRQAKLAIGAYQSRRNFEIIKHDGALAPTYQIPPMEEAAYLSAIQELKSQMEDIAGCHPLAQSDGSTGVIAASGIQIIRDEDVSRLAGFVTRIEKAARSLSRWRIALAKQFYKEPRYMAISESADPQESMQHAHDFRALTSGGMVQVTVKDGSAVPKSQAAQEQRLIEMSQAGMFSPQQLPTTVALLDQFQFAGSDSFLSKIEAVAKQQLAILMQQQQQPAAIAQAQAEHEAAAQLQKHQFDMELQGAKNQGALGVETSRQTGQLDLLTVENQAEGSAAQYQAMMAEQDRAHPAVTVALKGTLGAPATIGAERAAGLPQVDTVASIAQEQAAETAQQTASQVAVKKAAPPVVATPKSKVKK